MHQVVIAALFQLAPMCLTALEEASVLTMTYANVRRSGLVKTVPSSLVDLSTTALVRVLSCPGPDLISTYSSSKFVQRRDEVGKC